MPILPAADANAVSSIQNQPFPKVINHLPDSRLITVDCFHHGICFVLTEIDTYPGHRFTFSACNTKTIICGLIECLIHYHGIPRSIDFGQATYFTTVKCSNGLMLIEFTNPDVVSTILKLTWWNDGMALWRFSYSASWMAVSCKAGERFSRRVCVPWISVQYLVSFLPYPESWVQKLRDRNGSNSTHYYP